MDRRREAQRVEVTLLTHYFHKTWSEMSSRMDSYGKAFVKACVQLFKNIALFSSDPAERSLPSPVLSEYQPPLPPKRAGGPSQPFKDINSCRCFVRLRFMMCIPLLPSHPHQHNCSPNSSPKLAATGWPCEHELIHQRSALPLIPSRHRRAGLLSECLAQIRCSVCHNLHG